MLNTKLSKNTHKETSSNNREKQRQWSAEISSPSNGGGVFDVTIVDHASNNRVPENELTAQKYKKVTFSWEPLRKKASRWKLNLRPKQVFTKLEMLS
jgi:hypothetical protein